MTVNDAAGAQNTGAIVSLLIFREPADGRDRDAALALLGLRDEPEETRTYVLCDVGRTPDVVPEAAVSVVAGETSWRVARFAGDPRHHCRVAAELLRTATAAGARHLVAGPEASSSVQKLLNCSPVRAVIQGGWMVVDLS